MPQALPVLIGTGVQALAYYGGATAVQAAIIGGVVAAGTSAALASNEKPPPFGDALGQDSGLLTNVAQNVQMIPVVYGQARVGGSVVVVHVSDKNLANDNIYLHMGIVWSEGEIDSIVAHYADDVDVTTGDLATYVATNAQNGTDGQAAIGDMVTEIPGWTTDHRLRGVAYTYVRLEYDPDDGPKVFPFGIPTITADVKGVEVLDVRTSTTAWSDNPALCIYDYLTNSRYGRGVPTAEIDTQSFIDAANFCDQLVEQYSGGPTQKRYTCNGVVNTEDDTLTNLEKLLTSCRGMIVHVGGKYHLRIEKAETPAFTLNESKIIGPLGIAQDTVGNRLNRVRAQFFNPDIDYKRDMRIVDSTSFRTNDNNAMLEDQIDLPFTADAYMAQHIAGITLRQSRFQIVVEGTATPEGLRMDIGDVIYLTHETPGWTNEEFRVINLEFTADSLVRFTLLQYDSTIYDLDNTNVETSPGTTDLPDPFSPEPPTGLTITPRVTVNEDGTVLSDLVVTWTRPADTFIQSYRLEWKKSTDTNYGGVTLGGEDLEFVITGLEPGTTYDVRIQSISTIGARSAWVGSSAVGSGDVTAPAAPTGFSVAARVEAIQLSWTNPSDADFAYIEIWRSTSSSHAAGSSRTKVLDAEHLDPATGGTAYWYWIRSVDLTGNASAWVPSSGGAGETTTALTPIQATDLYTGIADELEQGFYFNWEDNAWNNYPWVNSSTTHVRDSTAHGGSSNSGLVDATGSTASDYSRVDIPDGKRKAWAGKRVRVQCWYRTGTAPASNNTRFDMHINGGATIGNVDVVPSASWQQAVFFADIPNDDTVISFRVYPDRDGTNESVRVDTLVIHEVPDWIEASNISDWIATRALTAEYLAATLTISNLFRTAGSGVRVELENATATGDPTAFPFWIGTGTKNAANGLFYYDVVNNEVVLKGTLSASQIEPDPDEALTAKTSQGKALLTAEDPFTGSFTDLDTGDTTVHTIAEVYHPDWAGAPVDLRRLQHERQHFIFHVFMECDNTIGSDRTVGFKYHYRYGTTGAYSEKSNLNGSVVKAGRNQTIVSIPIYRPKASWSGDERIQHYFSASQLTGATGDVRCRCIGVLRIPNFGHGGHTSVDLT